MSKEPKNNGKKWTLDDEKKLKQLAQENTPTRVMALKLERTPGAVENKAQDMGVSLKPVNQSPYNRPKK